ncbi:hypothetical protein GCM10010172_00030 [Paractinoplanes ferrugineus]|uniref:Neprosin PEP catalytic domain-containing protein n=1 Tax=Paractinoplanes ferrugineus TaxID=113564 RepID=A0A919MGH1_9ACTN|nr:neprosin family prolyl endopeptidase [Actinoplanes ferrugineus]GIE13849.1 hypothetical protein Afe05nite_56890 [Actinoplanes ferrugineus]
MLKSRRGLLAAGLAVAVVGAIGVASTLNAGAEQIAGAPSSPAAAGDQVPVADTPTGAPGSVTPPALLPWGERPKPIRLGKAGATSREIRRSGAVAARADTSGAWQPRGSYAPKGNADENTVLESEKTDIAPPKPMSIGTPLAAKADDGEVVYTYARGWEEATTSGLYATVMVSKPYLADGDFHSLAELSVQTKDRKTLNAVEVGWTVDRVTNGDDDPHLFVYRWVNGKPSCYNNCGFVQYSKSVKPGDTLAPGTPRKFGIQHTNGGWWVAFESEWLGFYPDSIWENEGIKFVQTEAVQTFGEVAATSDTPKTCMGNGNNPVTDVTQEESAASYFAAVSYVDSPTTPVLSKEVTGAAGERNLYGFKFVTSKGVPRTDSFRYGGRGTNAKQTACVVG